MTRLLSRHILNGIPWKSLSPQKNSAISIIPEVKRESLTHWSCRKHLRGIVEFFCLLLNFPLNWNCSILAQQLEKGSKRFLFDFQACPTCISCTCCFSFSVSFSRSLSRLVCLAVKCFTHNPIISIQDIYCYIRNWFRLCSSRCRWMANWKDLQLAHLHVMHKQVVCSIAKILNSSQCVRLRSSRIRKAEREGSTEQRHPNKRWNEFCSNTRLIIATMSHQTAVCFTWIPQRFRLHWYICARNYSEGSACLQVFVSIRFFISFSSLFAVLPVNGKCWQKAAAVASSSFVFATHTECLMKSSNISLLRVP